MAARYIVTTYPRDFSDAQLGENFNTMSEKGWSVFQMTAVGFNLVVVFRSVT